LHISSIVEEDKNKASVKTLQDGYILRLRCSEELKVEFL